MNRPSDDSDHAERSAPQAPDNFWTAFTPQGLAAQAGAWMLDAWQRSVLFADVRRQRGDQYHRHQQEKTPNVLSFSSRLLKSGLELERPVNYGLVEILPAEPVDTANRRPIVVVDPRAGHGPGIGGFKPDSEIGAALRAGHPCYFIGFSPNPVQGQTVEDVMCAVADFVQVVRKRHPESCGKPAVIGNCQAGWLVMMAAAVWPERFGPLILAGAPLSYWAGDNPMRYTGGLVGGSWLTALTSDLGHGRFDGAWLVRNFESLDPANTFWSKNYHLYANIDSEAPRYLGFEKYWGGYVFLNDVEMQYIVDNLFIGNRLSTAQLLTSDGVRIDFRNIRSPIVVFCSHGDNITPPGQALGWITDLYRRDDELLSHDQTILYATHDSIGHLGIFVSGSVGRKEHREFIENIDLIDLIPAGLYELNIADNGAPDTPDDPYVLAIRRRSVDDVRAVVQPDPESERQFAAAEHISQINLALYRSFMQPWVRLFATDTTARWLQAMHPLRLSYEWWSSRNMLAPLVSQTADTVRQTRQPVDAANPFAMAQNALAQAVEQALNHYRDQRDATYRRTFEAVYGSPFVQALAGMSGNGDAPVRPHPGDTPEQRSLVHERMRLLVERIHSGGLTEAALRGVFYVLGLRGEGDDRHFRHALALNRQTCAQGLGNTAFRAMVREQALLVRHFRDEAIAALPKLVAGADAAAIDEVMLLIREMTHEDALDGEERARLGTVLAAFEQARPPSGPGPETVSPPGLPDGAAPSASASEPAAMTPEPAAPPEPAKAPVAAARKTVRRTGTRRRAAPTRKPE